MTKKLDFELQKEFLFSSGSNFRSKSKEKNRLESHEKEWELLANFKLIFL